MDNIIFSVIAISLIIILPIFYVINKYKGKTGDDAEKSSKQHRKHKHKQKKHKHH